jgi:multidrug resistance efflux pump
VIERVFVREGDVVQQGQMMAQLDNSDDRVKLAQAQEALAQARHELAESEFRNDPATAGQAKIQADLHQAEVDLEQQRVAESALRAPIGGLVVTNKIEDKAGSYLHPGEAFGEIVAQEHMAAEMSVPETDLSLVKPGAKTALKLNAFPTITFQGTVDQLGAQTHAEAGDQYFMLRSTFDNVDDRARIGMAGRARISAGGGWFGSGWYPVGYVLLRPPVRWLWEKVWEYLP